MFPARSSHFDGAEALFVHQRFEHFCAGSSLTRWLLRDYRLHPAEAFLRITEVSDELPNLHRLASLVLRNLETSEKKLGAFLERVATRTSLERLRWLGLVRRWLEESWDELRVRGDGVARRLGSALLVPAPGMSTNTSPEDQRSARLRLNQAVKRSILELRAAMGEIVFLSGGSIIPAGEYRLPGISALCFRHTLWLLGPYAAIEVPVNTWSHPGDRALALAKTGVPVARMVLHLASGPASPFSSSAGLVGVKALSVGVMSCQWFVAPSLSAPTADSVRVVIVRSALPALTLDAKWCCPVGILLLAAAGPCLRDYHVWFGMQRLELPWTLEEYRPWIGFSPSLLVFSVGKRRPRRSSTSTELLSGLP